MYDAAKTQLNALGGTIANNPFSTTAIVLALSLGIAGVAYWRGASARAQKAKAKALQLELGEMMKDPSVQDLAVEALFKTPETTCALLTALPREEAIRITVKRGLMSQESFDRHVAACKQSKGKQVGERSPRGLLKPAVAPAPARIQGLFAPVPPSPIPRFIAPAVVPAPVVRSPARPPASPAPVSYDVDDAAIKETRKKARDVIERRAQKASKRSSPASKRLSKRSSPRRTSPRRSTRSA